ncbi:E3 ubiquitin-protein ligase RNF4-like [Impatiens glandulifera]|uniref:E3 ubiquitin-protein ligase RNF4-like n=1 Tax=Impatiens glandulifera TaxID=253017 RepID=UPI001FB06E31|nr:E3 ubiquitin-protein ligase RNF4-like [Impatiens glandulifera]
MSTRGARVPLVRGGPVRNSRRRKVPLDVDLNAPPIESHDQGMSSHQATAQDVQSVVELSVPTIDVEALDDDVVISSPRTFAEAKNNSRFNRRTVVVDLDSVERSPTGRGKRRRGSGAQTVINYDQYVNLEGSSNSMTGSRRESLIVQPPPEPTFTCPVCMGTLENETSTKCGHIFCKKCIKSAIAAQGKCPTCRRKITMKDTIRVFLPKTE